MPSQERAAWQGDRSASCNMRRQSSHAETISAQTAAALARDPRRLSDDRVVDMIILRRKAGLRSPVEVGPQSACCAKDFAKAAGNARYGSPQVKV